MFIKVKITNGYNMLINIEQITAVKQEMDRCIIFISSREISVTNSFDEILKEIEAVATYMNM